VRDVVIIHRENDWAEELPFALRSLKNFPHRKVWFFGHKPDWVTNVEHVPVADVPRKWYDIHTKYVAFLTYQGDMTDEVVSMYDDTYFIDNRYMSRDLPSFHWGTAQRAFSGGLTRRRIATEDVNNRNLSVYRRTIVEAGKLLEGIGVEEPLNYSLHVPFVFVRSKVPVHLGHPIDPGRGPVQWRTMGGNTSGRLSTDLDGDVKVNHRVTLGDVLKRDTGFLSTLNQNFKQSGCKRLLQQLFPTPCEYEREFYGSR
jgi:hypothetical protein